MPEQMTHLKTPIETTSLAIGGPVGGRLAVTPCKTPDPLGYGSCIQGNTVPGTSQGAGSDHSAEEHTALHAGPGAKVQV